MTIIELYNGHLFFILLRNIYGVPTFLPGTMSGIMMSVTDTVPIFIELTVLMLER